MYMQGCQRYLTEITRLTIANRRRPPRLTAAADRQIERPTDARNHNTFRVVYDSRDM